MASAHVKKQLFLSHAWGEDELGRDTHARVKVLTAELGCLGWTTWFDENEMVGNIQAAMANGIDDSEVVLVCVTKAYCKKVSAAAENPRERDNCLSEWTYANNRKKILVPIVMEPCLLNPCDWPPGVVAMHFGATMYVDASSSADMKTPAKQIQSTLQKMHIAQHAGGELVVEHFRRRPSAAPEHRAPPPLVLGDSVRHKRILAASLHMLDRSHSRVVRIT